jgi:Subtilase family
MEDREINIDEETFKILSDIANSKSDRESLASLSSADPYEFRKFLNESGALKNEQAGELLRAAYTAWRTEKSDRILVKLHPSVALAAANPQANLRPLHDEAPLAGDAFGMAAAPRWHIAELPEGAENPWDLAHQHLADQLGVDESAIVFAEPDLPQSFIDGTELGLDGRPFAAAPDCSALVGQDGTHNKVLGPDAFAWHLGDAFSQLGSARDAVMFSEPRTRIAHIDTGYDPSHVGAPERVLINLQRSFADDSGNPNSATDPGRGRAFPDNSGHGTGTIGILAGGRAGPNSTYLGGAYQADVVPMRVSNSVVLFYVSAFAKAIEYAVQQGCDVASISMGGLPSRAWSEAVNSAYEAGLCIVAAAGNNVGGAPSHHVVYPARYRRTIAVCGVMANGQPYYHIQPTALQGSWGPDSSMTSAIATFTPNIPWAVFGCQTTLRFNGEGTSAATPQVAAAVALWFEKYKGVLPRDWRRVEAVRHALFSSARPGDAQYLGHGILQARAALDISPQLGLQKTPPDRDTFAFLRVITGLGIGEVSPREEMFNLELTQRYLMNRELQEIVTDPEKEVSEKDLRQFMEAVVHDEGASRELRKHIAKRYSIVAGTTIPGGAAALAEPIHPACNREITIPKPPYRRIRAYAVDPSLSTRLQTAGFNEVTLKVRWEELEPGPTGEYLSVVDTDSADVTYQPVDLDSPDLLAQDGCPPSEGNAAFHQQMVYAIAMTTIEHFERALGRPVLWRPRINPENQFDDSQFVRQLTVRPHALRQANAFYSPKEVALLFGYFEASATDPGDHLPGSKVYACLSHDIVAHETTHAILDGMHRRFNEPTNPDVLALHEAFADIVALMQHFTIPEILENQIGKTRGDLKAESMLGSLAMQFGRASGKRGALRDAIGSFDVNGVWAPLLPDPADYHKIMTPHNRGALLVAAVFDAFISIYEKRTEDLLRIYTRGTGVLPPGAIHPDLVRRLAGEASKAASHVLNICIRALDYIPPVDITFGEYLRGIITADYDLVADDRYFYRVAFVEAFRRRGIYPSGLDTLSVDTLRWQGVDLSPIYKYPESREKLMLMLNQLKSYADACVYIQDREELFFETRKQRMLLHEVLTQIFAELPPEAATEFAGMLGLEPNPKFEVHELRRSMRFSPDGKYIPQVIVALTQSTTIQVEASPQPFRGGSTLIVDLSKPAIDYSIRKRIDSDNRKERTAAFIGQALRDPLQALFMQPDRAEPFAALHSLADLD